ncbi:GNAT family N-acetyltransferase [Stenotrophomonas sp.]|uniref:GNAT family N-acetyltransferase n=1 Tax=Stenotrophomonas sp. TaxID=69392 RepID=UPI002FC81254
MIRTLRDTDLEQASAVCMRAFLQAVAPSLSTRGVETFSAIAAPAAFAARGQQDNLQQVFDVGGVIKGVAELKQRRHVAMLFVDPDGQREGIGEALLAALVQQARTEVLTVSASLSSVAFYARHGFRTDGAVAESAGLVYQPMTRALIANAG